jgi:hypothetical protein
LQPTSIFTGYKSLYRIKPEEPNFKEGDWVYLKHKLGIVELRQYKKEMKDWINVYSITPWKPKHGEFYIFWDNNMEEYLIAKYESHHEKGSFCLNEMEFEYTDEYWNNIAPLEFIDTLKGNKYRTADHHQSMCDIRQNIEVIGNIYQNKELLDEN